MRRQCERGDVVLFLSFPHYRQHFLEAMEGLRPDLLFLIGDQQFMQGVTTDVESPLVRRTPPLRFFAQRRFVWMPGVMMRALSARVCVVELNPRIVNSWLLLVARRLLRRPTVAWGHAWPRSGPASRSDIVRSIMRRLAHRLLVYTESSAQELLERGKHTSVYAAPNAIYSREFMRATDGENPFRLTWIGRMVAEKRPLLAIEAFVEASAHLPPDIVLTFVGDGPQGKQVRAAIAAAGMERRVSSLGWQSDPHAISQVFAQSIALVASGYVGLNVTQSLGFGVPILYPRGENHAPEIEAVNERNSIAFAERSASALAEAMVEVIDRRAEFLQRRHIISDETRSRYSSEVMAERFAAALTFSGRRRPPSGFQQRRQGGKTAFTS